jgi:hypothetical protein
MWFAGVGVGVVGFLYFKKRSGSTSAAPAKATTTPTFTQAQEVQDFQIFSALTGAQQASDLNFLSQVAGLFSGGPATGTTGGASSSVAPAPASTGQTPPAIAPYVTGGPNAQGLYAITNPGWSLAASQAGLPVYEQDVTGQYIPTSAITATGPTAASPTTGQYLAP